MRFAATLLATLALATAISYGIVHANPLPLLFAHGLVGKEESSLMADATILMLIVIVPILALAAFFAWWYRAGNEKAMYTPNWEHSKITELVWWAIPIEVILVIGALTWTSTHELDPKKPLDLGAPVKIQVIALPWRWLFIYPEQQIATLGYVEFPAGRDIEFDVTADAPMNSFWIPDLGTQIYAMTGMVTHVHLTADMPGTYRGVSANYSGSGFDGMSFDAIALPQSDFDSWVQEAKSSQHVLDADSFVDIAQPSTDRSRITFGYAASNLYNTIVNSFNSIGGKPGMRMNSN